MRGNWEQLYGRGCVTVRTTQMRKQAWGEGFLGSLLGVSDSGFKAAPSAGAPAGCLRRVGGAASLLETGIR